MDNKEFTITGVRNVRVGGPEPVWMVEMSTDGGDTPTHAHAFPHGTLAWRAAEYGIDPTDVETLLEVVLHEPHMAGHDHTSPDFLYNCDQDSAREALHARVAEVKQRVSITDPSGRLAAVRAAHIVDPADHAAKVAYSSGMRAHNRAVV